MPYHLGFVSKVFFVLTFCYHHPRKTPIISIQYAFVITIILLHVAYYYINHQYFWSNYSDLTRPHPKWWFSKGNPLISGKSRLVKYYNLARIFGSNTFFFNDIFSQVLLGAFFLLFLTTSAGFQHGRNVHPPVVNVISGAPNFGSV